MASIERRKTELGVVRFVARYRDPAGRSRERRFLRREDAERFLSV